MSMCSFLTVGAFLARFCGHVPPTCLASIFWKNFILRVHRCPFKRKLFCSSFLEEFSVPALYRNRIGVGFFDFALVVCP